MNRMSESSSLQIALFPFHTYPLQDLLIAKHVIYGKIKVYIRADKSASTDIYYGSLVMGNLLNAAEK